MKHLEVLREAQLVHTRESGRHRVNSLNTVPIRQIYERWVSRFEELWSNHLLRLRETAEQGSASRKPGRTSKKARSPKKKAKKG